LFQEYGRDIAASLALAKQKEIEYKKIQGLSWIKENIFSEGMSLEQIISNVVERAVKGTDGESACVYLYDENSNCLLLQQPVYGASQPKARIDFHARYDLKSVFPYAEQPGGPEITIPLIVNLKMIGVLHVQNRSKAVFTQEHLEWLQFLASFVSAVIENARLYLQDKERQIRLEASMKVQQELVKYTLEEEGFAGITEYIAKLTDSRVFLFDRFFHLIAYSHTDSDNTWSEKVTAAIQEKKSSRGFGQPEEWIALDEEHEMGVWRIAGGGDLLGYLALVTDQSKLDVILRMTLNHALNIYAVQFVKHKLVLDAKEQVKDSFFNQLFVQHIQDKPKLLQYASLLNWNAGQPHYIGLLSIVTPQGKGPNANLLEEEAIRSRIGDRLRQHFSRSDPDIVLTRKDGYYLVLVPESKAKPAFWRNFLENAERLAKAENEQTSVFCGISQVAGKLEDYYLSYKQAQQTLSILCSRFPERKMMQFQELGAYTVLYHLGDPLAAPLFLRTYLDPLLQHSKNRSLFDTLRVYLQTNGNIKETAERLYIHRSSLNYRLEKIKDIMKLDIDDAEQRFNLMMAYKLYDLFSADQADERING
jgi:sugar diacid utilization regulator